MTDEYEEGQPLEISLAEVLGTIEDSYNVRHRLRLLDDAGEEFATLTGRLTGPAWVAARGEQVAELTASGGGLIARVRIPLDEETRCTISPDGTMACTLPSGAKWITTPLRPEGDGP